MMTHYLGLRGCGMRTRRSRPLPSNCPGEAVSARGPGTEGSIPAMYLAPSETTKTSAFEISTGSIHGVTGASWRIVHTRLRYTPWARRILVAGNTG